MALTPKQQVFVDEYLIDLNASQAAERAGYKHGHVQGSRLLANVSIRAEIDARLAEHAMSSNEVLARLTMQGRADLSPFMSANYFGKITLDLEAVKQAGLGSLIKKVTNTKDGSSIEFYDAQTALVQLGRYRKLFTDRVEVEDWRSQAIADIRARKVTFAALAEAFNDVDLATQLFREAGVITSVGTGAEEK